MTSKVKGLIEVGNTRALETWLTNTKQTIKGHTSLRSLVSAEDDLARILLPADLEIAGFYPVKTTGNGDCLYNAASIGIAGDEHLSDTLRAATAAELYLNATIYSNHPKFDTVLQHPDANLSAKSYKSISLPDEGIQCFDSTNDFSQAIQNVAVETCLKRSWSTMIHMFALSSVLGRVIHSVYPETNKAIRPFYHSEIKPIGNLEYNDSLPVYLMWSRDGNLDNRHGSLFEPNHFVPLLKRNMTDDGLDSDDDLILSIDDSAFLQITSSLDENLSSETDITMLTAMPDELLVTEVIKDEIGDSQENKQTETKPCDEELQTTGNDSNKNEHMEAIPYADKLKQNTDTSGSEQTKTTDGSDSKKKMPDIADGVFPRDEETKIISSEDKSPQSVEGASARNENTNTNPSENKLQQTAEGISLENEQTETRPCENELPQTADGASPKNEQRETLTCHAKSPQPADRAFPMDEQPETKPHEDKSLQPTDGASANNEQTETNPSENELQQTADGTSLENEQTETRPCENELLQTADGASLKNEQRETLTCQAKSPQPADRAFLRDEQPETKPHEDKSPQHAGGASANIEQTETNPSENELQQTADGTSLENEQTETRPCENELPQTADEASPKNEQIEIRTCQAKSPRSADGIFPRDEEPETKPCEGKLPQPANGASASNAQTETYLSENKLLQTADGSSIRNEQTETRPCENDLPQTADWASPKNEQREKIPSEDKSPRPANEASARNEQPGTKSCEDKSEDEALPRNEQTETKLYEDKLPETADSCPPRKEKTEWRTCEVNLPPSTYLASPRIIQTDTVPCKDALPQTTDGTSPMKEKTEKIQSQDALPQTTDGPSPRNEQVDKIQCVDRLPQTAYGPSSREEQTETVPCADKLPRIADGFSSSDDLPLSTLSKTCTLSPRHKAKVDMDMSDSNEGFSTADELSLASLRGIIDSQKTLNLTEEKKSTGLSTKTMKRKLKPENDAHPSTSKSASISYSKQKKKRETKPKAKQATDDNTNMSDNEANSDNYESDEDLNIITAGNESLDFSSESDDEDSSQEELETFGIKWSHKLKRIEPKKFKGPEPGAIKHLSETASPLNHFFEIFPENMFSLMAKSSNSYVPIYEQARRRKSKDENWVDQTAREITVDDIRAYVGIRMIMAVDPKPCVDDYWSANPALGNQKIIQTMPRRRFQSIQRYFHVNDPTKDPTRMTDKQKAKEVLEKNPLYKVSPLMEAIRKKSMALYHLHQEIAVDEAMIKCHGQHSGIVGAPNKPAKRGFKIFVAADGVSGYLWNFQVYMRKQKEIGLTQRVVENLTEPVSGRNHIVFIDKYYTSVPLALSLLERSTFLCGSFNTGRKLWPSDLKVAMHKRKKEDKLRMMKRGEYHTRQTTDGKLVATVWKDSKLVYNLSSCYNPITNAREDRVHRKSIDAEGKWAKTDYPCPQPIIEFNKFMGGVDRHDHLRSSYTLQRSSTRWWTYFGWFAVDVALINSYLMFRETHPKVSHKAFQLKVADQLIGGYCERVRKPRQSDIGEGSVDRSFAVAHETMVIKGRARSCRHCSRNKCKTSSGRTRETTYGCMQCGVNLHRECFLPYHEDITKKKITTFDVGTQAEIQPPQLTPTKYRETNASTQGEIQRKSKRKLQEPSEDSNKYVPQRKSPRRKRTT